MNRGALYPALLKLGVGVNKMNTELHKDTAEAWVVSSFLCEFFIFQSLEEGQVLTHFSDRV